MIRVHNLDKSLAFYTGQEVGMKLLRKREVPEGKYTLALVDGDENEHCVVEFTHNWGRRALAIGERVGHLAVGVPESHVHGMCTKTTRPAARSRARRPGEVRHHRDGLRRGPTAQIELIERKPD